MGQNGSTFPIYEILIRLVFFNPAIGEYRAHVIFDQEVIVVTHTGVIIIPLNIINKQQMEPELIDDTLLEFLAFNCKQKAFDNQNWPE